MKKLLLLLIILFGNTVYSMYHPVHHGRKLKYDNVKLTNNSPIPLELSWIEITPTGQRQAIIRKIDPEKTITVKIGEIGGYLPGEPAKIIYEPISDNPTFRQEFIIDLPSSSAFVFTAEKLADILNKVWVPGVLKADDKGNFSSFQYMNLQHPSQWERILLEAGAIRTIKY